MPEAGEAIETTMLPLKGALLFNKALSGRFRHFRGRCIGCQNVTIQAVIARAFFARSNLVLNRKNHALGDCFTRKKRSFAVTPLFRVDG